MIRPTHLTEPNYINKDLICTEEEFYNSINNDFIGKDFTEQLEWAMLMIQSKFKQVRLSEHIPPVSANHFDKAYLMSSSLNEGQMFYKPFTDLQATPEIFPNLNIKMMLITDSIQLHKVKEIDFASKRNLTIRKKYAYELSLAYYKKDTECFYGIKHGYELNPGFFKMDIENKGVDFDELPRPISLHPNYIVDKDALKHMEANEIADIIKLIGMSYQIMMSMYYEWCIYIKEYDNIGLVIPIEPSMLSEIYKTSILDFDSKKRMIHFVRDHYRRKVADPNEDYSIFIKKYLRGEYKFKYKGFSAEIIPPKYDLNRAKTKKKFVDVNS